MSFSEEYAKLRKKRLAEQEDQLDTQRSFSSQYSQLRKKRLEEENQRKEREAFASALQQDPAAVWGGILKTFSEAETEEEKRRIAMTTKSLLGENMPDPNSVRKVEDTSGLFKSSSLFDDGYQFGDASKAFSMTTADTAVSFLEGFAQPVEGLTDLLLHGTSRVLDLFGADEAADNLKDWTSVNHVQKAADWYRDFTGSREQSYAGDMQNNVASGLGQVSSMILGSKLLGALGLEGAGLSAATTGGMFASSMGSGIGEAYKGGATDGEAWGYGALQGAVEAGSELIFGGLGKGLKVLGMGKGVISVDDRLAKKLSQDISNKFFKSLVQTGVKASAEGLEEVLAGLGTAAAQKLTYLSEEEWDQLVKDQNLWDSFVTAAIVSGFAQAGDVANANKTGRDMITGKTDNETKVIEKVFQRELAQMEKEGKVTGRAKSKLYDKITDDMERGYISTDDIESTLANKEYTEYSKAFKAESAAKAKLETLKTEYASFGDIKRSEMTRNQLEREKQLEAEIPKLQQQVNNLESASTQQRQALDEKMSKLLENDRLTESYAEKRRTTEAFTADLSKYSEKQQKFVQKAIDSKVLNNTNRSHELVDLMAKIHEDKDVDFDFTNNKKLAESGFSMEGATINGFVGKNGITVNVNSQKALNSVVGHEITHVLEGSEMYDALKSVVETFARTKGEYDTRLSQLTKLYEGKEGYTGADAKLKIEQEVIADLVGDYLFTDKDFVQSLSTQNRNVFQKIYDEVKYLCRVAVAGSKEARQLEQVKKTMAEVYRGAKGAAKQDGVKYSLLVKDSKGNELAVDPYKTTRQQTKEYMIKSRKGLLDQYTYFPASDHTPATVISTLRNYGQNITDRPLAMQAKKARQSQNKGEHIERDGTVVRHHAMTPDEIQEAIEKLDNPIAAIHQKNRVTKKTVDGKSLYVPAPDNFVFFVELNNGKECAVVIEFDSYINNVQKDGHGDDYHTTVTVFEPDRYRNGEEFDYIEYLSIQPDNTEVEIVKESSSTETASSQTQATVSDSELSNPTIPQTQSSVNPQNAPTEQQNEKGLNREQEITFSLSNDTKYADAGIAMNKNNGHVAEDVMEAQKLMRERVATRLREMVEKGVALPEDIEGKTDIANSSYDVTEENTTICPRSLSAEAFVDAVSEYVGRPLTVEEQIYISQDLQGRSMTPECTYCYVATDRKAYRAFLGEYVKQRDAVIDKLKIAPNADVSRSAELYKEFLNGRKDTNPMYNRFKMWVDAYKNGTPMINASHLANMSKLMGDLNEFGAELKPQIEDAMKYAQSASWAKKRVNYVAYNGHILKWKQDRINKLNSHYGLRMYSFSDFHPAFVLENMQMISDASVRGLKMLGYTKDIDFVDIFAPTGMNINVSTFGFESGGNVYENNIIGAEWEKAKALRAKYPNVGVTFVATNDATVNWALEQDWIDVVIPYHLVRTGAEVAKAFNYTNYTSESSDVKDVGWKKGDKKYIAPTEHNNDKATYLEALAKNHLKPRFERFIDNPNYMKLVNECRQSASESKPVQPVFNEEAINRTLAKLEANGYYQPIGGTVERMYEIAAEVAEDMSKNIGPVMSLAQEGAKDIGPVGWKIRGENVAMGEPIAPLPERAPRKETAVEAPIAPLPETVKGPMPEGYQESAATKKGKERKWVGTSTESEAVDGAVAPEDIPDEIRYYKPIPNKKTLGNANAKLEQYGYDQSLADFNAKMRDRKVGLDDIAMGERLIQEAVKRGDTKTASDLIMDISILGTELGQKVQALSIIKRLTPEGQLKMLQRIVERGKSKGDKAFEGVELTQEMSDHILTAYNEDGSYDQKELNQRVEEVKQQIADQMKVGVMDYLNEWRYLSMLGNPKTHIRNIVSNIAMAGTRKVKNALARTAEDIFLRGNRADIAPVAEKKDTNTVIQSGTLVRAHDRGNVGTVQSYDQETGMYRVSFKNKKGQHATVNMTADMISPIESERTKHSESTEDIAPIKERTKTWKRASEVVKNFAKETTAEEYAASTEGKYRDDAGIKEKRQIFKTKAMDKISDFNSNALSWEDKIFSKSAYKSSLQEYLTANGIRTQEDIDSNPELIARAKEYAKQQAKEATFQQDSYIASKISEIERRSPLFNVAIGSVLPFKKTPINVAKTALSYSPLGLAKGLYESFNVKNGKYTASEAIDQLAQGVTGTSLALIGYMLAQAGMINGAGDDDKEGEYDYQLGKQAYSLNFGGDTYSLSWLSPVAMPLFVGANAYEQLVEAKEWNADVVVETLEQTLNPLSEMSFLSSLDSVLSSYDSGIQKFVGIFETAGQSYATQFIPTLFSQIAAATDDVKRSTQVAADSGFKFGDRLLNQIKYKIPGLRQTLEPMTDIWGEDVPITESVVETFFAPWSARNGIGTGVDEEIKDIYRQTGDGSVIPSIPGNTINYDGVKYEMSAKEFTEFKQSYGQIAHDTLQKLFETQTYQEADSETRADMASRVYDYARDESRRAYFAKRGIEFTNATEDKEEVYKVDPIVGAIAKDMSVDEYKFFEKNPQKHALSVAFGGYDPYQVYTGDLNEIKSDKKANGDTVSGSRKKKVLQYLNDSDLSYGQKILLYKSEYPSDNRYDQKIVEYIAGLDMTTAQKYQALEALGFNVDSKGIITWD